MDSPSLQQSLSMHISHNLHHPPHVFLDNCILLCDQFVKFVCLLDSTFSLEPHLKWFYVEYEWSLNTLKVLSDWSQGRDGLVLLLVELSRFEHTVA